MLIKLDINQRYITKFLPRLKAMDKHLARRVDKVLVSSF